MTLTEILALPVDDNPRLIQASDTGFYYGIAAGAAGSTATQVGSPPFLAALTARVDPSGSDTTGTIGDSTKPFLTVQAALTAFETLGESFYNAIDVGGNYFGENLTTSLHSINFRGESASISYAFASIHFTALTDEINVILSSVGSDYMTIDSVDGITVYPDNALVGQIISAGHVSIRSLVNNSEQDLGITANGIVNIENTLIKSSTISAPGFVIKLQGCGGAAGVPNNDGILAYNGASINSLGSVVYASGTLLNNVEACSELHLIDARVFGTNSASSTVYDDVLLAGSAIVFPDADPHIAGAAYWVTGVLTKSNG